MDLSYIILTNIFIFIFYQLFCWVQIFLNQEMKKLLISFHFFFLFIGVFSGTNLYFWFIPFAVIGVKCLLENSKVRGYFYYVNLITFFGLFRQWEKVILNQIKFEVFRLPLIISYDFCLGCLIFSLLLESIFI